MSALGQTIRRRREELGLAQGDLARRLGVAQQTVSRWERGLAAPRTRHLGPLAEQLAVEPALLQRLRSPAERAPSAYWEETVRRLVDLTAGELVALLDRVFDELRARSRLRS